MKPVCVKSAACRVRELVAEPLVLGTEQHARRALDAALTAAPLRRCRACEAGPGIGVTRRRSWRIVIPPC
jgi:hypothetical protein